MTDARVDDPSAAAAVQLATMAQELEQIGLAGLLAEFPDTEVHPTTLAGTIDGLNAVRRPYLRAAAELLLLGRPVAAGDLPPATAAAVDALEGLGIARRRSGRVVLQDVTLLRPAGVWLFAAPPSPFRTDFYFGADSVRLARYLTPRPGKHYLDLCSGTGYQGLLAARAGATVDMVEIAPAAAAVAGANAALNGVTRLVRSHVGDLYEPLPTGSTYDEVVANVPFLPTVDSEGGPADTGPAGIWVFHRVLAGLSERLEPAGTAHLTALLLIGSGGRLLEHDRLAAWAAHAKRAVTVTLGEHLSVSADSALMDAVITDGEHDPSVVDHLVAVYRRLGADAARTATVRIEPGHGLSVLDRALLVGGEA